MKFDLKQYLRNGAKDSPTKFGSPRGAKMFKRLSDLAASGEIFVQGAKQELTATVTDFPVWTLTITYFEYNDDHVPESRGDDPDHFPVYDGEWSRPDHSTE